MSNLVEVRNDIEKEEVQNRAGVSEAVGTKLGQSINFINRQQYDSHSWNLNGPYAFGVGSTGIDGIFVFMNNVDVYGFQYYSDTVGTSDITTLDIHWLSAGGTDNGTIFSIKPSVDSTSASGTYTAYNQITSTTLSNPTGHTLAVLSKTQFDAGDALRLDIDTVMANPRDFQFTIFFRPR